MAQHWIQIRHNIEAAHRNPQLGGPGTKCWNLHGHSWLVEVTIATPELDDRGVVADFGDLKKAVRGWLDEFMDHGAILGAGDPLVSVLRDLGSKLYRIGADDDAEPAEKYATGLSPHPTVENVATVIQRMVVAVLD